jgi:hypothetical protein
MFYVSGPIKYCGPEQIKGCIFWATLNFLFLVVSADGPCSLMGYSMCCSIFFGPKLHSFASNLFTVLIIFMSTILCYLHYNLYMINYDFLLHIMNIL